MNSIFPLFMGASLGALLRYFFSNTLPTIDGLSLGMLAANWLGALLIGIVASPECLPQMPAFWKPLIITGFLGALTTFSSFSLETVLLLQQQRYLLAILAASLHLFGSLLLTALGLYLAKQLF